MKAKYDNTAIPLTQRFTDALVFLMEAECEMLRAAFPHLAKHWESGRCYVGDLARGNGLDFVYGESDSFEDGLGDFAVVAALETDGSESIDEYLVRTIKELGPLGPGRLRQLLGNNVENIVHRLVQRGTLCVNVDMKLELGNQN